MTTKKKKKKEVKLEKPEPWLKVCEDFTSPFLASAIIHRAKHLGSCSAFSDAQMMMTGESHKSEPGGIKSPFLVKEDGHLLNDDESQRPRVITPFPSPKLTDLPMVRSIDNHLLLLFFFFIQPWKNNLKFWSFLYQFQGDHKERLYWGTYRPQVYFGVRARYRLFIVALKRLVFIICLSI